MEIQIQEKKIGLQHPTYFIADIAANHDGDLERARLLIQLAKEAGADAAKFQNFSAPRIVSDYGFRAMGGQVSHQAGWQKSVFEVYQDASIPFEWTPILKEECERAGIDYFSSPYDFEAIDWLDPYVPVYKVGSGEMTGSNPWSAWPARANPSSLLPARRRSAKYSRRVRAILKINPQLVLMQCNTNYTASLDNYDHMHLNVLKTYRHAVPRRDPRALGSHARGRAGAGRGDAGGAGDRAALHRQQ
jgi:sialic acid synthase SpsE